MSKLIQLCICNHLKNVHESRLRKNGKVRLQNCLDCDCRRFRRMKGGLNGRKINKRRN